MATRRAVLSMGLLTVVGCSAAPLVEPPSSSPASPAASTPVGGQSLASMGLTYGPANFALPLGVAPTRVIDQDNVVTMIFTPTDGARVHEFLAPNLVGWGWMITASSADSLIFTQPGWEGATTISTQAAGLTLRVVPPS